MRVVMFTNSYRPIVGGVETSIIRFRKGLLAAGHDVHILAPERKNFSDDEPYIWRLPAIEAPKQVLDGAFTPSSFEGLMELIVKSVRPHAIHSHHPFAQGFRADKIARKFGLPLIYTYHTRYDMYAAKYISFAATLAGTVVDELMQRYLQKCDHLIAPTPSIATHIAETYPGLTTPVTVIPTPVDLSAYTRPRSFDVRRQYNLQDKELLLYLGRIDREKNIGFLLESFAKIMRSRPRAHLLLVGHGKSIEKLQKQADSLGLGDRCTFAGGIDHSLVPACMAAADLFVFSSLTETQGLVLIEAMAAGTPVVAVRAPGSADVLAEGGGVLVEEDIDEFTRQVCALLDCPPDLHQLGRDAARVVQRFAIPTATQKLVSVYQQHLPKLT